LTPAGSKNVNKFNLWSVVWSIDSSLTSNFGGRIPEVQSAVGSTAVQYFRSLPYISSNIWRAGYILNSKGSEIYFSSTSADEAFILPSTSHYGPTREKDNRIHSRRLPYFLSCTKGSPALAKILRRFSESLPPRSTWGKKMEEIFIAGT